ncbi:hypothetical protein [Streptomyces sp. NPDC006638]|uniref:hypothetical protein n=1 Tax=Streptomyces sp. NPDC006638 TaxID=3157183 RepID=UPI0033A214E6
MPDITEILKRAKPRQKSVFICLAGDDLAELDKLERQLADLAEGWKPDSLGAANPAEKINKQIQAVRTRMKKGETEFRFQALGDKAWSDLVAAHPSAKEHETWDPDTFPKALVSTCCVDPVMTPEQAAELFEVLNEGQREEITQAAYDVNAQVTTVPFSFSASAMLAGLTAGK